MDFIFYIYRPKRLPQIYKSNTITTATTKYQENNKIMLNRGSDKPFFRFDRLHYEQVVVMKDGSVVIVQVMHGILQGIIL